MKRVLIVHYSQTGQLSEVMASIASPLQNADGIDVDQVAIVPEHSFEFPWPFLKFFDTFPETVYQDVPAIKPPEFKHQRYDLVILAYQVWFLSPSMPMSAFLRSEQAKQVLADTPVVTVIACRDMWLMAQERVKAQLSALGARLVDNVVLTDECGSALSFFSTPLWMLSGHKGPFKFGIPRAGVSATAIAESSRFGDAMVRALAQSGPIEGPMLRGLGAVRVNHRLIPSEKIAIRSFRIWGGLLRLLGKPGAVPRRVVLVCYILFLISLIFTVVPVSALIKRMLEPFAAARIARQRAYFAQPSGEAYDQSPR